MNYYQYNITRPESQDEIDLLIAQMAEIGFESFEETDSSLIAYISEKDYHESTDAEVASLLKPDASNKFVVDFIADRNWNEVWESNYPPVLISNECMVRAPFHNPVDGLSFDIVIKPKMAFGTAHHETTAHMLKYILGMEVTGKRVLDMGCGSGVLAILCAMKGAEKVVAIDFDEWSYSNTLENAEINHISNIEVILGDAEKLQKPMEFDLILANINKNILTQDMQHYTNVLTAKGDIVFSGFYNTDIADIESVANHLGLKLAATLSDNNWAVTHFKKE